jgi:prepilin peptidase CpaA
VTFRVGILGTLVVLLLVASITDARRQMIYNWNTYPGIVLGFVFRWWDGGTTGLEDSMKGFAVCGGLMLVCFVLFGLGGGDLKLIAMMGAFLGFERGVEALLWTLVLGGILGAVTIVWQLGFLHIVGQAGRQLARIWRAKGWVPLDEATRQPLKQTLFLAPAGLLATLIVTCDQWTQFFQQM